MPLEELSAARSCSKKPYCPQAAPLRFAALSFLKQTRYHSLLVNALLEHSAARLGRRLAHGIYRNFLKLLIIFCFLFTKPKHSVEHGEKKTASFARQITVLSDRVSGVAPDSMPGKTALK